MKSYKRYTDVSITVKLGLNISLQLAKSELTVIFVCNFISEIHTFLSVSRFYTVQLPDLMLAIPPAFSNAGVGAGYQR